jgi:hypothetical protein
MRQVRLYLLDDLISAGKQGGRDGDAQRLGRPNVDRQLKARRLLER